MAPDPELVARAERELALVHEEWLDRRGVVALEVARRWVEGQPTDEVCIRVTVEEVLPPEEVPEGELFPSRLGDTPVQVRPGGPARPEPATP